MAHDSLTDVTAAARARLLQELDAQFRAIEDRHEQVLARSRQELEIEADERWSGLLDAARGAAQQQVESAVQAVRAELEEERAVAMARVTEEAERRAAVEIDRVRAEEADRVRAEEQERLSATVDAPQTMHRDLPAATLLGQLRQVDEARSISETLATLVRSAGAHAERVALFVANGAQLDEWHVEGSIQLEAAERQALDGVLLSQALQDAGVVRGADGAIAAPLLLDGVAVAVLYASSAEQEFADDRAGAVEVLASHASAHLAYLTALRTVQARHWIRGSDRTPNPAVRIGGSSEEEAAARRYARLLVSEIRLYHDAAVRIGQRQRDLLERLGPEIDRARRLYEERVPAHVAGRAQHFHDELVQTLAGGDPSLLK